MTQILRGMTWSHPRGFDPLVACSAAWKERMGVQVTWDKRSLQDFEAFPVEELARKYDLIIIDHPHVGQITSQACLAAFDDPQREADRAALAAASVGPSWPSYVWNGKVWALPVDAATQVSAWRPDLLEAPPTSWTQALALARRGEALSPLRPPHNLMSLMTLSANLDGAGYVEGADVIASAAGAQAYEALREMIAFLDVRCFDWDPIAVFEAMCATDSSIAYAPLIYGYVSYAAEGFRPRRLRFCDMPELGAHGPAGSTLGGTGLAVSVFCESREAAMDFAYFVASDSVQSGLYAASGGQPAHAMAWDAQTTNAKTGNFYRDTRRTLDLAALRPRHNGYMAFQDAASQTLNDALRAGAPAAATIARLNQMFRESLKS